MSLGYDKNPYLNDAPIHPQAARAAQACQDRSTVSELAERVYHRTVSHLDGAQALLNVIDNRIDGPRPEGPNEACPPLPAGLTAILEVTLAVLDRHEVVLNQLHNRAGRL